MLTAFYKDMVHKTRDCHGNLCFELFLDTTPSSPCYQLIIKHCTDDITAKKGIITNKDAINPLIHKSSSRNCHLDL